VTGRKNHLGKRLVIQRRRCRATGATIVVIDTKHPDNDLDPDGGRWATVCDTHSTVVNHRSQALALSHAAWPTWCEECAGIISGCAAPVEKKKEAS
jgi:hypothetical protein